MIETKFKETEIGRIPEDWEVAPIGTIADVKTGPFGSALHAEDYVLDGPPIITVEHIGKIHIDTINGVPHVSSEDYKRLIAYSLKESDLVFSRVGSVDRCSYVSRKEDGWLFSGRLLRVRLKLDLYSLYLTYHLQTNEAKQRVLAVAVGLAMPSINTKILNGVLVAYPRDKSEQIRIATALSNVDALISELDKLIEKKQAIKQGAMQQLLIGKKRLVGFTEPWKKKKLGEICDVKRGVRVTREFLTSEGEYPVFQNTNCPLGFFDKYNVESNTPFVIVGGSAGLVGFCKTNYWAADDCVYFTNCRGLYLVFLYYTLLFRQNEIKRNVRTASVPRLDRRNIEELLLSIPCLSEQYAIASALSSMDEEISSLEAKRGKYESIKMGMMQQLLTGKIRLVEPAVKSNSVHANVHFRRSVLAAEIADRLCEEPTFGHVKMEKMLFLSERLCHIDIGSHYHRDAAGPYDNRALRSIDSQLKKQKWFEVQRTEKGNRYVPMQNRGKHKTYFDKYYSEVLPTFNKIINTFRTQRTEQCEIVATLYSAWEDLLHSNKPFTDADIANEVLNNWHDSKKRISQERWQNAIRWMRENGFAPNEQ